MLKKRTVLWAEDNSIQSELFQEEMEGAGYRVFAARSVREAEKILAKHGSEIHYAVIDSGLVIGGRMTKKEALRGTLQSGLRLGKLIRRNYSHIECIGYSALPDQAAVADFFREKCLGYWSKVNDVGFGNIPSLFEETVRTGRQRKVFIVHGHDEETRKEVEELVEALGWRPIVLLDQPSLGRTILEKFEDYARTTDLAFILLTPDDKGATNAAPDEEKARARQNVILELGYFLGIFRNRKGRVVLLHKGELEIPSDISGLVYISIEDGVKKAQEEIRRELEAVGLLVAAGSSS